MTPAEALLNSPLQIAQAGAGVRVGYRQAGRASAVTHVLLHGIGSNSGSWAFQLAAADSSSEHRVLAWDAPGYGQSDALVEPTPLAQAYARRLSDWLDQMGVQAPITLVGHSLGALMATSAAVLQPARVQALVLLSPAQGYGDAALDVREKKLQDRLDTLARLGPEGMAQARGRALLSPHAAPVLCEAVTSAMAAVDPAGYTQATHMLSQGTLLRDLSRVSCPVRVACGREDTITTPEACAQVAQQVGNSLIDLGLVGHACSLEAALAVNALLGLGDHVELGH